MSERITAMDIENQTFSQKIRGYDPDEVSLYLASLAEEIERLNLDNASLLEERGRLKRQVEEHRDRERTLQETLVTAQKMAGEYKEKSRLESELMMKEARIKAERMLEQAQDQLASIESEVNQARLERDIFENRLRSAVEEHLSLLELRKKERAETDNVRFLRRRGRDAEVG